MHEYTPNGATWEPQVDLIDDSDAPTASNLNTAPTGNADRTQWIYENMTTLNGSPVAFTASGTFIWPKGVKQIIFEGWGGGGGGGGGPAGGTASANALAGGSGGAGAPALTQVANGTPGDTYTVTVGPGGGGGSGGIPGGAAAINGAFGGPTTVTGTGVSLTFIGGAGGYVDNSTATTNSATAYMQGPPRVGNQFQPKAQVTTGTPLIVNQYGDGGAAVGSNSGSTFYGGAGSLSEFATIGGVGGTTPGGEGSGGPASGGAGGGGGAGPGGNGGMGGNGGIWGFGGGSGAPGAQGTAAAANTGAGGGGGGGGGNGAAGGANGASGSSGGSGFLTLYSPVTTNV